VKQGISPGVVIVIILVVVIVVAAVGYFAVLKPKAKGSTAAPADMKAQMEKAGAYMQKQQQERPGMTGGTQGATPGGK